MERPITEDRDADLWILVTDASHAMLKARQKELDVYNITPRQAFILMNVHELGDKASLKEISKHVFREVHSISEQTGRMEKKGLLKKIRDIPGKTIVRFEITEKGFEVLEFIMKRESLHTIMSVLSEEERKIFSLCLEKLLAKSLEI